MKKSPVSEGQSKDKPVKVLKQYRQSNK